MSSHPPRVLALFGTRPEVIKLAPVISRLESEEFLEVLSVATSQHRDLVAELLTLFSIEPDFDLGIHQRGQTLTDVTSRALSGLEALLSRVKPDLLLIQGDTSSALAGALAAFYNRIPVGHVEAGLRSFDRYHPFPEEVNRRLIASLADLHFAPLPGNAENLLQEGVEASRVFVTGNTVIDSLQQIQARGGNSLSAQVPPEALAGRRMVLVTAHRRESFGQHLAELCHALEDLVAAYPDLLVVYPVHPNPEVRRTVMPLLEGVERILLLPPLPYHTFVEAMASAYMIITDSGGVQEEAPALGKPVLVFRKVTEREEGVAAHGARVVGLDRQAIVLEASRLLEDAAAYRAMGENRNVYGDGQASRRIVEAILHHFRGGERPEPFAGIGETKA